MAFRIEPAQAQDIPLIMAMIRELAEFEKLTHILECTEAQLTDAIFGPDKNIEALLGWVEPADGKCEAVAYAVYFHNFSTFLGKRGLYLEDLYVRPGHRHRGYARAILSHLAALAVERNCGRFEWTVLDWNTAAQDVYRNIGAVILPDWRIARMTGGAIKRLAARKSG